MEGTKAEADEKVTRILKLIKNKNKAKKDGISKDSKKDAELVKLVQDFHKQYQSLYALYDHLKEGWEKKASGRNGKEGYSPYSSSSDSEYYSPYHSADEVESNHFKSENSEAADPMLKSASTTEEKETSNSETLAALRTQGAAEIVEKNLNNEADQRKKEHHRRRGSSAREKKLEDQLHGMKVELKSLHDLKKDLEAQIESQAMEAKQLSEKNSGLHSRVLELELILEEKGDEKSDLLKKLEDKENSLASKNEDLMAQLGNLQREVDSLRAEKGELEGNMAYDKIKAKGLTYRINTMQQELDCLRNQKTELELQLSTKTKEISQNLIQISNLQYKVNCLSAHNGELEGSIACDRNEASAQVRGLINQLDVLQQELVSLRSHKTELESQLGEKTKETSESLIQIGTMRVKLARKNAVEQRMVEERDGLLAKVKDLELEADSLGHHKKEMEEQIRRKAREADQFKEEKVGLLRRIRKLEGTLKEKTDKLSAFENKCGSKEIEASTRITALKAQVDKLEEELSSLQDQKSMLQKQNERLKSESSQSQTNMEVQNVKLRSKIADLEAVLKQQETTLTKSNELRKQMKQLSAGSRINLQVTERKMEELAEEFRKKCEDHIRILYRRILVAEQLHSENKENYQRTKEKLEQENKLLGENVAAREAEIRKLKEQLQYEDREMYKQAKDRLDEENKLLEAQVRKLKDVLQPGNNVLAGFELVMSKLEQNREYLNRISKISNELLSIKKWVTGTSTKTKRLQHSVDSLVAQLDEKEEQEFMLRDKVLKLEAKLGKEGGHKLNLMKTVNQLEKKVGELESNLNDKDVRLLGLGEEKREAIRQLCILIDYHRNRSDHLKNLMSNMKLRSRQAS